MAFYCRGAARCGKGQWQAAFDDFEKCLQLDPKYADAYANRAFIWASCLDERFRDAEKATKDAKKACELSGWKAAYPLEAYAAACAEAGDFAEAVKWQKKALDDVEGLRWRVTEAKERLQLYEAKKPFRTAAPRCGDQ